ncbi:MAG: NUMOD4 motif-containing HNH endonuclease [Planctomycetaceae bacterium]|jgi:hypothetical protein|nr:NUMOD4 motif-containing HNH endonuclease [Planctomycetaceae bacterium]
MKEERYKSIPGYEGFYSVSNYGRVYSKYCNRHLKPTTDKDGYLKCVLCAHGTRRTFTIHRLVAITFKPHEHANLYHVNHIDGNRKNNQADNLEWTDLATNLGLRRYKCYGEYNAEAEEVNIVSPMTNAIIRMCYSLEEAELITSVPAASIRKAIQTGEVIKSYKFERGF